MSCKSAYRGILMLLVGLCLASFPTSESLAADNYIVVFNGVHSLPADAEQVISEAGGNVVRSHDEIGILIASSDNPGFVAQLQSNGGVTSVIADQTVDASGDFSENVFPDTGTNLNGGLNMLPSTQRGQMTGRMVTDPSQGDLFQFQWNLKKMNAEAAWATGALGSSDVTVAVLDTGLDYLHQELVGKVDLDRSISLVPSVDALVEANFPGAHPIADIHNFGTYLGALVSCNAVRTACVAPNTTLVGVKVADEERHVVVSALLSGIKYAADIDADVILTAFPFFVWDNRVPEEAEIIEAIDRAVQYAHSRGSVVISSVGPPGIDFDDEIHQSILIMPTQARKAVGISATDPQDGLSDISGFGLAAVDVAAPGGWFANQTSPFTGSVLSVCSGFSLRTTACQRTTPTSPHRYVFLIGVLGATAQAAGVAALIDGEYDGDLKANQLKKRLFDATDDLGVPGFDNFFGHGRLNMLKAAQQNNDDDDD
jgi:lantibiotic leader peptide-processing serine protease